MNHVGLEHHCGGLTKFDVFPGSAFSLHPRTSLFKNLLITGLCFFTVFYFVITTIDMIICRCTSHEKNQDPVDHDQMLQAEKKRS